jgi:hypothetical protein
MPGYIFKTGFANRANNRKQKNGGQKNSGEKNGDESVAVFIFLPAIFLLSRSSFLLLQMS